MANQGGSFTIDDREWQAYQRKFTPQEIDKVLKKASGAGARAAANVVKADAPIGTSDRPSQFYRREGYGHGTLRSSVRASRIRPRGVNARVIGHVIGPQGRKGFTRHWVEGGTRPHGGHPGSPGRHWFVAAARGGSAVANTATQRILETYARDR